MRTAKKIAKPDATPVAPFKPRLVVTNDTPQTDAERVAAYQAAMVEWHASQERAKQQSAAYRKHVNRNAKKTGPLAKRTKQFARDLDRRFILSDHPNDCAICLAAGAWDGESLIAAHAAFIEQQSAAHVEQEARIKAARDAYYAGGFKITIDGQPTRFAAHVKAWKKSNRDALCQGSDRYGLTLRPHGKYGFTDHPTGYWNSYRYQEGKNCGPYDGVASNRLHASGYSVMTWNGETVLYRHAGTELFTARREVERDKQGGRIPDLFTAGRADRKRLTAQLKSLGLDARKRLSDREARDVTRLIRSLRRAKESN